MSLSSYQWKPRTDAELQLFKSLVRIPGIDRAKAGMLICHYPQDMIKAALHDIRGENLTRKDGYERINSICWTLKNTRLE